VASGSLGLVLCLKALVESPSPNRTEVLAPSFTFASVPAAIIWCGLQPVFCDIEDRGWHLDPDRLETALAERGSRIAAILACSTFGTPAPEEQARAWRELADRAGVPLVLDSAAGLGATASAAVPDAEVFSLHATKPLPVGEGGIVAFRDASAAGRLEVLANHGLNAEREAVVPGLNAKLDEWHCAAGLVGLDRLADVIEARRARAEVMRRRLSGTGVRFQHLTERSATQFVPARMHSAARRDAVLAVAGKQGVEMRSYFNPPLHSMPAYRDVPVAGTLEVTERLSDEILSLPMANDLTDAEIDAVVRCVSSVAASADAA
jgi:dTDP-4-amino-4,6-dideoxygalactose transaminase